MDISNSTSIETLSSNPLLLSFAFIWVLGYVLKHKTEVNNKYIPLILIPIGILLGLFLIELSITGLLIGALISLIQIGGYDAVRSLFSIIFEFKKFYSNKEDFPPPDDKYL